jgi:hypothetical protein
MHLSLLCSLQNDISAFVSAAALTGVHARTNITVALRFTNGNFSRSKFNHSRFRTLHGDLNATHRLSTSKHSSMSYSKQWFPTEIQMFECQRYTHRIDDVTFFLGHDFGCGTCRTRLPDQDLTTVVSFDESIKSLVRHASITYQKHTTSIGCSSSTDFPLANLEK